ncbi:MAG: MBL fold metallo-hydrolase [Coriobacteriales bacterium]|jgi:glyoxylase-like metal-dependent hydrolase (beta-lactamase superfamily II)
MVEEVYGNIFRIGVPLPGNPLKELNAYFIRGDEADLLIDTGFRRDACREALQAGLDELGSDIARRDVLITHLHSDHCGMADEFAGSERSVYAGRTDLELLRAWIGGTVPEAKYDRFAREGFDPEALEAMFSVNPAMTEALRTVDERFKPLDDGDILHVGGYALETLFVPGHTPGNCMFYIRDEQVMFTGDHVLFDITPNITSWPGVDDALGDYLDSLRRVRDLPVKLALPGHRGPGDYAERIDALLAHHANRLDNALAIVRDNPGLNATEIAGKMRWKIRAASWETFPIVQKWFAVGECLSHLDYHLMRGNIRREQVDGIWRYWIV